MPAEFVHLHAHSHYSLRDSINKIPEMIGRAAEAGMPALALTDHGVMFGAVEFYAQAKEAGVKPIIGMEAYVAPGPRTEQGAGGIKEAAYHLTLLAADTRGYKNLMRLATAANVEGFYYRPRIDKEILAECAAGLIGLSGCLSGEAAARVLSGQREEAKRVLGEYSEILGEGNFYVEIMRTGAERQQETNAVLMELAGELGLELVATNDVHYLEAEDAGTHELWLAVGSSKTINDPGRRRMSTNEYYMRTPEEMGELFRDVPEAVRNTVKIAERAEAKIELGVYHFPRFDPGEGRDTREMLSRKARAGAVKRYGDPLPGNVEKRLENELETMNKMGFADYMLIVQDVVDFARRSGIPVGPGRGSAVGSVVCYSLGITDLDPLPYDLIFGRFINEGRNEMPDIDLDFCQARRGEIIEYVTNKYGKQNVAQIITFSTMAAKASIRDVARVMDVPYGQADAIAKLVPAKPGIT
ncbi:MAG: DNA polymerase III subunit alpha, partial [Planctomycetes bacterium]|nr:DNA polymerase III subunit alpha [Planctomycetota bacterium]